MTQTKMPPELFTEFKALSNELTWLSASWDSFLQLFGPDHGQVALLNRANGFFGIARVSIRNSVFLGADSGDRDHPDRFIMITQIGPS